MLGRPCHRGTGSRILARMARTAPGLVAALVLVLGTAAPAPAAKCRRHCTAKAKVTHATGWHNGTYDGGPGDPIIAPVPARGHR